MTDGPLGFRELSALSVERLHGVGPKKRDALAQVGVHSVADLITHYPRRYVDRTNEARVADLVLGTEALVIATVDRVEQRRTRNRKVMVTVRVSDGTGSLSITFFNQAWRARQLTEGVTAAFFGKVDEYRGRPQMTSPVVDLVGNRTGKVVAIYPQSEKAGLTTWELAAMVAEALRRCRPRGITDPVPAAIRDEYGLMDRAEAFDAIHGPETMAAAMRARTRLVFDELFRVQLALLERKRVLDLHTTGIEHRTSGPLLDQFVGSLPFALTGAQQRTIDEIATDLARPAPMHRLLQGDVGAGKTLVAVHALLSAVEGGHQGAFMAPTEVLAEQHHRSVRALVEGMEVDDPGTLLGRRPVTVELLSNKVGAADRRRILDGVASGGIDLVVGTHALIQDGVGFASLGVVVVDEQHRFGVEQRAWLRDRGRSDGRTPDVLVMTATPIPRTAAMTVYGDLDVSILDELPPGRTPIVTRRIDGADEPFMWEEIRSELDAGRQAFVVCPLIEDSDKLEAASAEATFERLVTGELAGRRVGLLHGRMKSAEKDEVMDAFRTGATEVLVATTVIEVGVDVPNATVMVIESAERFGIAQLHQLRGRVGRGSHESRCYLVSGEEVTDDGDTRLDALVSTTDGFELAEIDLDIRGEGTIFDQRQSGRNDLKLASLRRDREWVGRARRAAADVVSSGLDQLDDLADELAWFTDEGGDADYLMKG